MLFRSIKDIIPMFLTPLYIFTFDRHKELKSMVFDYLQNDKVYEQYSTERYIKLSGPNLHKEQMFSPYYHFMMNCYSFAMQDLGYTQNVSMTAMWSTKQEPGMYHHPHKHGNSFLAGVFYFHGGDKTFGTNFFNPDNLLTIAPNRDFTRPARLNADYSTPFRSEEHTSELQSH